jgi:hypothetical protein
VIAELRVRRDGRDHLFRPVQGFLGSAYAAIRALKESMRAAVIIAARPPDTSLDRLLALNEEAFARSVRAMSDQEVFELEKTVRRVAAPLTGSQPALISESQNELA